MTPEKIAEKRVLRVQMKARIAALSSEENARISDKIAHYVLQSSAYQTAKTLFCFVGTATEINTLPILRQALLDGKTVCVPFCSAKGKMEAKQILSENALKVGAYGILTPDASAHTMAPNTLDLVLVPCLSADVNGNRLGYGGGYYDRYLPRLKASAVTVCLCRSAFLLPRVPHTETDCRIEQVLSENGFCKINT
ncbi:MAG: 5-formyltetrahydrofolate cyclo-ligase [Ruthenibacterium sp.]